MSPWCTAVSSSDLRQPGALKIHKYSIYTYILLLQSKLWERNTQYSLLLCNLQLSIKTVNPHPPRWICKSPVLKIPLPHLSSTSAFLGLTHLPLEMSVLSLIILFLQHCKTLDSSLCPYQELKPMRKGPLWLSLFGNSFYILVQLSGVTWNLTWNNI